MPPNFRLTLLGGSFWGRWYEDALITDFSSYKYTSSPKDDKGFKVDEDDEKTDEPLTFEDYFKECRNGKINSEDHAAYLRMSRSLNEKHVYHTVRFVKYDENVYNELVRVDAQAERMGKRKVVSLDPEDLAVVL